MSLWGLFGRSYYYGACFSRRSGFSYTDLVVFRGRMVVAYRKWHNGVDVGPSRWQLHTGEGNSTLSGAWGTSVFPRVMGTSNYDLENCESRRIGYVDSLLIETPLYIPSLFFALVACYFPVFSRCRRHMRKRRGLCVKCAYDLRASQERCPECGTGFSN